MFAIVVGIFWLFWRMMDSLQYRKNAAHTAVIFWSICVFLVIFVGSGTIGSSQVITAGISILKAAAVFYLLKYLHGTTLYLPAFALGFVLLFMFG